MKETDNIKKDGSSLSLAMKRTPEVELSEKLQNPWISALEAAGLPEVPTTARRARDLLEKATADKPLFKRKRKGTKATEYHASVLPLLAIKTLYEKQGGLPELPEDFEHVESTVEKVTNIYKSDSYSFTDFLDEFALIPGYRVQVSAGYGSVGDTGDEPCRHLAFRRKWLRYRGFKESELVVVWAKGDSMEPTIHNNNTLLINTSKTRPTDGNIYVIRQDDMLWVKRIQVLLDGSWLLISDNPAYKPLEIKPDAMDNLQVIGQVVNIAKDIGD
ncbi:helix-turn-helix domain-containing protein [Serratia liquefaciens]|uniref:helix-turn-helix domain-containing protein n=1 Tax=Serratia liquefaciens TaxID=614 RepID=UPI0021C59A35|nr:S24 family peptidase [Serratia liquefaciens]